MPVEPAVLVKDDQDHLIHPLHHPSDHLEPMVYVKGRGATITDIQGASTSTAWPGSGT